MTTHQVRMVAAGVVAEFWPRVSPGQASALTERVREVLERELGRFMVLERGQ